MATLTPQQQQSVYELAQSNLEKGRTNVGSGVDDPAVRREANRLIADITSQSAIANISAYRRATQGGMTLTTGEQVTVTPSGQITGFIGRPPTLGGQTLVTGEEALVTPRGGVVGITGGQTLAQSPSFQQQEQVIQEPVGVVSAADDSFGSFIQDRNPFTAGFEFLVEKGRGRLARFEEPSGGARLFGGFTGERVSGIAQTAPFFIPATAPTFLVGTGVGAITHGGITESRRFGLDVQESTGIPAPIVSTGFTGLQVGGGILGIKGLGRQVEKLAGFPKFDVKFISKQTTQVGDDLTQTVGGGVVTRKGLFGKRETVFAGESLTKIDKTRLSDPFFEFKSVSRGVSREFKGIELPTTKLKFAKPRAFGSQVGGLGKRGEQAIGGEVLGLKGAKITRDVEGFEFVASARQQLFKRTGKRIREPSESIILGKGFELPSGTISKFQTRIKKRTGFFRGGGDEIGLRLRRTGKGEGFGMTKPISKVDDIDSSGLFLKGKKTTTPQAINEQILQSSAIQSALPKPPRIKPVGVGRVVGFGRTKTQIKLEAKQPERIEITPQKQLTRDIQKIGLDTNQIIGLKQPQIQKGRTRLKDRQDISQMIGQLPKQTQKQALTPKQAIKEEQTLKRVQRTTTRSPLTFETPILPSPPRGLLPPIVFPSFRIPEVKRKRPKGKRKLKRTPSLVSLELGIEAPTFEIGETTGLVARPVIRKRKKKKKGGKK